MRTVNASPSVSGTMIEWSEWNPSERRPVIASVKFSLAGANRTTWTCVRLGRHRGDFLAGFAVLAWRDEAMPAPVLAAFGPPAGLESAFDSALPSRAPGPPRCPPPRPGPRMPARRPDGLAEGQPLRHRQRLRPPVAVDAGRLECPADDVAAHGELPREHVSELLAALAETGLDEAPQLVFVGRVQLRARRPGFERPDLHDRRLHLRRRFESVPGHHERNLHLRVVLDEYREIAHLPGRGRDPLRDFGWSIRTSRGGRGAAQGSGAGSGW